MDGVVSYSKTPKLNKNEAYTQLFRNGCIEAVGSLTFMDEGLIPSEHYELRIVGLVKKYLETLSTLKIEPPIYMFLSFTNIKGYKLMVINFQTSLDPNKVFSRQDMLLPELLIDNVKGFSAENLQPIFNIVWNAFGYERSHNFDENGKWIKD